MRKSGASGGSAEVRSSAGCSLIYRKHCWLAWTRGWCSGLFSTVGDPLTQVLGFGGGRVADRRLASRIGSVESSCCGCFRRASKSQRTVRGEWICNATIVSSPSSASRADRGPAGICCAVAIVEELRPKESYTSIPSQSTEKEIDDRQKG